MTLWQMRREQKRREAAGSKYKLLEKKCETLESRLFQADSHCKEWMEQAQAAVERTELLEKALREIAKTYPGPAKAIVRAALAAKEKP